MKKYFLFVFMIFAFFVCGIFLSVSHRSRLSENYEIETRGENETMKSFEWWYTQRALPYEFIPRAGFQKAVRYLQSSM